MKRKHFLIGLGVVGVLTGGFVAYRALWGRHAVWRAAAADLPEQIRLARAEGVPLELADIGLPANVPASENSAPYYRKAFAEFKSIIATDPSLYRDAILSATRTTGEPAPDFLAANLELEPAFEALRTAAKYPECDFERDWSKGFDLAFTEYSQVKDAVKLLTACAQIDARMGNVDSAVEKLRLANRMINDVCREPTLIGALVQNASVAIIMQGVEAVISELAENQAALKQLEEMIAGSNWPADYRFAMSGEVVLGRIGYRSVTKLTDILESQHDSSGHGMPSAESQFLDWLPFDVGFAQSPEHKYGNPPRDVLQPALEARFIEYSRETFPVLMKAADDMDAQLQAIADRYAKDPDPARQVLADAHSVFGQASVAFQQAEALALLAVYKVKLLRYKAKAGKYPADLSVFGDPPIDPMDGKPLRYRQTKEGFLLYSVGRDRTDNGGLYMTASGSRQEGADLTMEHPMNPEKIKP